MIEKQAFRSDSPRRSFPRTVGIQVKLASIAAVLTLCLSGIVVLVSFNSCRVSLASELRSKLSSVSAAAAANIDVSAHQRVWDSKDESTNDYKKVKSYLQAVRATNPEIRYIYTMVPDPAGDATTWHFVVDAETDPKLVSHVGDDYDVSQLPDLPKGLNGPSADHELQSDQWGRFLSGYAPIQDSSGKAVAIVGVDMTADAVAAEEADLQHSLVLSLILAEVISLIAGAGIARYFTGPIRQLVRCTDEVANGNLQAFAAIQRKDEMGYLAGRFNKMVESLRDNQGQLVRLANNDTLTGIPNHRRSLELLRLEVKRAEDTCRHVGIILLDLDNFRLFNDTYDYQHGDEVLKAAAAVITSTLTQDGIAARYGGDQFLIILPLADLARTIAIAQRIVGELDELRFSDGSGKRIPITASLGLSVFPTDSREPNKLISLADIAMTEVRRRGGNGFQSADLSSTESFGAQIVLLMFWKNSCVSWTGKTITR
jgi:diguanylate cyclase (GGDEF)-like protein